MQYSQGASRRPARHTWIVTGLIIAAVVLGGGGSPTPGMEMALQFLAAIAALAWLWLSPRGNPLLPQDAGLWSVAVIVLALPLLHLIPLPPALWTALPGRETQVAALALIGAENSWQPLSTSPARTLASLLAVVPPLLLFAMTGALDPRQRRWLIVTIAAMAGATAVFGAVQMAGGRAALRLYDATHPFVITGFQANRNATADVLLIGIVAVGAIATFTAFEGKRKGRGSAAVSRAGWWLGGLAALFALATVFTASRAGIALLPVALIACGLMLRAIPERRFLGNVQALAGAVLALALGLLALFRGNHALRKVAERFDATEDGRTELWADSLHAIGQYWPVGSGMGTFVPTFIAAERLEVVDPSTPNRAHNDYLELALEAGLFGILALALVAAILAVMAVRFWRRYPDERVQVIFALAVLAIVAGHSIVDYPLRSMSLACLAAVAAGLLALPPRKASTGPVSS